MNEESECLFCGHQRKDHKDSDDLYFAYCKKCGELCKQEEYQEEGDK